MAVASSSGAGANGAAILIALARHTAQRCGHSQNRTSCVISEHVAIADVAD